MLSSQLINEYTSIEEIYNCLDQIANPRIQNMLINNKENALLSKELVTIDINMNIDFNLDDMKLENLMFENMIDKLHELDIFTFDKILAKNTYFVFDK